MPGPNTVTRRRALGLGAAVGLAGLVRFPGVSAAGAPVRPRSFVLDVPASAWARGGGRTTGVLKAPRRFDLLGLRGRGLLEAAAEVRVRKAGGAWSAWTPFGAGVEHAPDAPRVAGATDPVWAGGADELQLRAARPPRGLRVHFVAVPRMTHAAGTVPRAASSRAAPAGAAELHAAPGAASSRAARAAAAQAGAPPPIVPRAQWGADAVPPRAAPLYGDVQMAFVHHTVSANDYTAADSASIVLGIAKYHRDTNGWNDIGYNFLVDQFGQVFEGRAGGIERAVVGAQAQGWNSHSTGCATIGTFTDVPFPEAGVASLTKLLAWKLGLHGVPSQGTVELVSAGGEDNRYPSGAAISFQRISGHRDGCNTSCPGDTLYTQLPAIRARVGGLPAGPAVAVPKLSLAAGAALVTYGTGATFGGTLLSGGQPVAGAPVVLQKQGSTRFVDVARATTKADGSWTVTVPWRRAAAVRALATVAGAKEPVRSATAKVGVGTVVTLAPVAPRVLMGRSALLSGQVRPGGAVRVHVEKQTAGGWARVRDVPATVRSGRFVAKVLLRKPGVYRLTARAGTAAAPSVYVRAVRRAADVAKGSGGAPPSPPGTAGAPGTQAAAAGPTGGGASAPGTGVTTGSSTAPTPAGSAPPNGGVAAP